MTSQRDEISGELLSFIHACIDSVEQLQILLLLVERSDSNWTAEKLSRELRSTESSVKKRLKDLSERGVLAKSAFGENGIVCFMPSTPEIGKIVKDLVALNKARPHRVIAQIFAKPDASIQSFAEAFKFKKEEK